MISNGGSPAQPPASPAVFATTHWSEVLRAGRSDTPHSKSAMEALCQCYWFPLYAFVRRKGYSPEDAQDLTQEFFARFLAGHWVARADPGKGRFRSFLLMIMKRFLAKEWNKERTLKRGGPARLAPPTLDCAETRYRLEPSDTQTPDQAFERQWALTLLQTVLGRLRQAYVRDGKGALFEKLESSLIGSRENQPYASLAAQLGMTEGAVKVAVCRLRERYRECLREEIEQTVDSQADIEDEMRHLFRALAHG